MFLNAELAVYRWRPGSLRHGETWSLKVMSVIITLAVVCVPADYDEIILESRSSELLLRNFKIWHQRFSHRSCFLSGVARCLKLSCHLLQGSGFGCSSRCSFLKTAVAGEHVAPILVRICATSLWNWHVHSPVVGFFGDDPRTCLTPCVDARTWKGGPTGVAMAIRGRPVGVTNSLNRNWIYRNETFRG